MSTRDYVLGLTIADLIALLQGEHDTRMMFSLVALDAAINTAVRILERDEAMVRPRRHVQEVER